MGGLAVKVAGVRRIRIRGRPALRAAVSATPSNPAASNIPVKPTYEAAVAREWLAERTGWR